MPYPTTLEQVQEILQRQYEVPYLKTRHVADWLLDAGPFSGSEIPAMSLLTLTWDELMNLSFDQLLTLPIYVEQLGA